MCRTIKLTGEATVTAPADITVVRATIEGVEETFEKAMQSLARCTGQVKDAMEAAGIPRKDLKSSQLSVQQNYREEKIGEDRHGNDKFRMVPDGFSYVQNVSFEFPNDNEKLSRAIGGIMGCDVTPRIAFSFKSSDPGSMSDRALEEAAENARREAEIIMKAAGTRLGRLVSAERGDGFERRFAENDVAYAPRMMKAAGTVRMDFDPEDVSCTRSVTLEWEIDGRPRL